LKKLLRSHPYALNQRLTISALPSDLEAKIGGTELIQILLNLAFNAVQSVERCHDTWIRAEEIRDPLELAAFTDGPQEKFLNREGFQNTPPLLAVSVEDDGSGIPPESMARLFETYFTTKPRGRGTGLGLSIILRLVKSANGAIHVTSRPKGGTRFTVYLPARTAKDPVG
jgi:signal transduction histidine kinase